MALRIAILTLATSLSVMACPSTSGPDGSRSQSASPATASTQAPSTTAARSTQALSADVHKVTHLGPRPAPAADSKCLVLPKGQDDDMTRVLTAVRRLSCEPALYYRPGADVEKELGLPKGVTFEFNGPRSASLQWTDPPSAAAVAKAAGVAKPVITTAKKGAWALRSWRLGSNATTGELDIWPPGRPMFAVRHDYDAGDKVGMVKPLTGEQLGGWIGIEMPDSAVPVKDDEVAVKLLARAAETLAANPKLLRAPIDEVRKTIGLVGERFRVAHKTHGIGEPASGTVDVQTVRTQVGAMAVVTKLGLMGSIRHSRARDSSHYLLVDGARESHAWRGLTVKARFQLRPAAKYGSEDPDDYLLENLTFSP